MQKNGKQLVTRIGTGGDFTKDWDGDETVDLDPVTGTGHTLELIASFIVGALIGAAVVLAMW